jgi:uroporphyrinogen decarboxylase
VSFSPKLAENQGVVVRIDMPQWKASVLNSKERLAMPLMTHPGINLTGHSVREAVTDHQIHYEAIRAVAQRFPTAAATSIMDLSVEAEAFGAAIRFGDDEVPSIISRTVDSAESVELLAIPDLTSARLPQVIAASQLAAQAIDDRPMFGECIGPFSLAARLFDVSETLTSILLEPDTILALVEKCTRFLTSYCSALKSVGVNGVVMAEPVAGVVSEELCHDFSSKFIKKIVQEVQDRGFFVILHNCGETDLLVNSMQSTGAAGLHFGNRGDIVGDLKKLPADTLVFGNIDPVAILQQGSPGDVHRETALLLELTKTFPNFVLSSGCDVAPGTPLANIDGFFAALKEFNQQRRLRG